MFQGRKTYYEEWVEQEGLEIIRGFHIDNMMSLDLRRWERIGAPAAHIDLEGTGDLIGAYVAEIGGGERAQASAPYLRRADLRPLRAWRDLGLV